MKAERVKRHELGAGTTERLALLPSNAHMQGHRLRNAEEQVVRTALAQQHLSMDGAVADDGHLLQEVYDEIVIHPVATIREIIDNLIHGQALAILRRTAATACCRSGQVRQRCIVTNAADHSKIRLAERTREQFALGVPVAKEQDDITFFKVRMASSRSWHPVSVSWSPHCSWNSPAAPRHSGSAACQPSHGKSVSSSSD